MIQDVSVHNHLYFLRAQPDVCQILFPPVTVVKFSLVQMEIYVAIVQQGSSHLRVGFIAKNIVISKTVKLV